MVTEARSKPPHWRIRFPFKLQTFASFREYNFALLVSGHFAASIGQMMRVFLRGYLIYEISGSAIWLGAVNALTTLPMLVLPFLSGVLADRMDRRRLLLYSELLLVMLWAATSVLILGGWIQAWHLLVTALLSGTVQSFERPARMTLIPTVVSRENVMNAVALNSAAQSSAVILGPVAGALLFGIIGIGGAFLATSCLQALTFLSVLGLRWSARDQVRIQRTSVAAQIREGLGYVRRDSVIFGVVLLGIVSGLLSSSQITFLPVFAADVLGDPARGLSVLLAASGFGTLCGALLVASLGNFLRKGLLLMAFGIGNGALLLAFSFSSALVVAAGFLLLAGLVSTAYRTMNQTVLQLSAGEEFRGRVMGLSVTLQGLSPLGALPLGLLVDWQGVQVAIGLAAMALGLWIVLVLGLNRQLRDLKLE